jgi:hypothetical protein
MEMNTVSHHSSKKKIVALSAAGLVLVAGATVTSLAAWTDTEWIFGGADGTPGVGTSAFEVQQNVTLDTGVPAADAANWVDAETSPGQQIDFGVDAAALTPGDTVYAFVRLRTEAGSDAGELVLNPAVLGTGTSQVLFDALDYEARIITAPAGCDATAFAGAGAGTSLVPAGSPLVTAGTTPFDLAADATEEKTVCIALTLPADGTVSDALQGLGATPVWNFTAISQ